HTGGCGRPSAKSSSELTSLRERARSEHWTFEVGDSPVMGRKIADITGLIPPPNLKELAERQNKVASQLERMDMNEREKFSRLHPGQLPELKTACEANASKWDWRDAGKVTPIRDQDGCGSCWAFATIGAYEGSYAIRNSALVDASEQCVLSCSRLG